MYRRQNMPFLVVIGIAVLAGGPAGAAAEPWTAPVRASKKANPVATSDEALAAGAKIYQRDCASCHGAGGKGDGQAAKALDRPASDFTSAAFVAESDGALFWKITEGRAPMPSYDKTLSETDRWSVVTYIRTLAKKADDKQADAK